MTFNEFLNNCANNCIEGRPAMTFQEFLIAVVQHPIAIRHNESWEADEKRLQIVFSPGTIVRMSGDGEVRVSHCNYEGGSFTPVACDDLGRALDYALEMAEAAEKLDREDREFRKGNQQ